MGVCPGDVGVAMISYLFGSIDTHKTTEFVSSYTATLIHSFNAHSVSSPVLDARHNQ